MRARRAVCSALVVAAAVATVAPAFAQSKPADAKPADAKPSPAESPEQALYDQHMANGVRLFKSRDLVGAATEFQAAYAAIPRASPLINLALTYRELGEYPKAVRTLEKALTKHRDTMDDEDAGAAQRAIVDMKSLYGFVVVHAAPEGAAITVDGEAPEASGRDTPIPVAPGPHELIVTQDGFLSKSEKVTVASGETKTVEITLAASTGTLHVVAAHPTTAIEVDGVVVGRGTYEVALAGGSHTVRAVGETQAGSVKIEPGKTLVIDLTTAPGILPPLSDGSAKKKPDEPKRGVYGALGGAVLIPFKHPVFFATDQFGDSGVSSGGYVELRGGYRVHTFAAFEGMLEYGNVVGPRNGAGERSYSLTSVHFGPLLRLMSPGDTFRFVGTLGGGLAYHVISYKGLDAELEAEVCPSSERCESSGLDFFMMSEAGVELDLDGVLIGAAGAFYLTGTKGMNDFSKNTTATVRDTLKEPYDNDVLPMFGPRLYIGYAFW